MIYFHNLLFSKVLFTDTTMLKCILVLLSLVLSEIEADSLESVANSVRATVLQLPNNIAPPPSRARDLSVEIPQGAKIVGKRYHDI